MDISDFNIDVSALPKLTLNEDKGRELLGHMLSVGGFQQCVLLAKVAMFEHQCRDHLNFDLPARATGFAELSDYLHKVLHDYPNLETVWTMVNRSIDRHLFLIITAYASVEDNLAEPDDIELVGCGAYLHAFTDVALIGMEGHATSARITADLRRDADPLKVAEGAAAMNARFIQRMVIQLRMYIESATSNKNYGRGSMYDVDRD